MVNRCLSRTVIWICLAAGWPLAAQVPRPAGEFTIHMTDGKQIRLSQYKGKVCVLAFLLTYCPHCQKIAGILSSMQNELGKRGFQALGSAIEPNAKKAVPGFIKQFHPAFPAGYDGRDPVLEFLHHPSMLRLLMPQLVFIDRKGTIRAQWEGDDQRLMRDPGKNIRNQIESLLKEGAAPQKKQRASSVQKKAS